MRSAFRRYFVMLPVLGMMAIAVACSGDDTPTPATVPAAVPTSAPVTIVVTATPTTVPSTPPTPTVAPVVVRENLRIAAGEWGTGGFDTLRAGGQNRVIQDWIYDPLVGLDVQGEAFSKETGIASDWKFTGDGSTYTFTIRQGVKFHNGDDLTGEDVKFTMERWGIEDATNEYAAPLSSVLKNITVTDGFTVEVSLSTPKGLFLLAMSHLSNFPGGQILPKGYYESVGVDEFRLKPVGSGPYKLVEFQVGAGAKFEQAFPEHFSVGEPRFSKVDMFLVTEESTRIALLRGDTADFIDTSLQRAEELVGDGFKIFQKLTPEVVATRFQLQREGEVLQDINLRKALSFAINREEINEFILSGKGQAAGNVFAGQIGGEPIAPDPFDPAKAKEFLNLTPYGEGGETLRLQLQTSPRVGWPGILDIATALQGYWKDIGIETDITYRDFMSIFMQWMGETLPGPTVMIFNSGPADWSGSATGALTCGGLFTTVCDTELDKLVNGWNAAPTLPAYEESARNTERYVRDQYIMIPIVSGAVAYAGNEQVPDGYSAGRNVFAANWRGLIQNP